MNWPLFWQLLVTAIVAFCGAWLAHSFVINRDRKNKRRDERIVYLIDAYRKLESISNRSSESTLDRFASDIVCLESAIADIQLFGSIEQICLARAAVTEFVTTKSVSLDDLLEEIRKDLRMELQLEPVTGKLVFLRFHPPSKARGKRVNKS
jgi:hypothetical protein